MATTRTRFIALPLVRWLIVEFSLLMILSVLWLLESRLAFYSAFIGGLIFLVPNTYFVHRVFRYQGARKTHLIVSSLFRAESIKLALTAVFFAAVFILMEPVHVPALLITFAVMVVMGAFLRVLVHPRPRR
ncbi:MAG: ATP synthase subunit I [Oleiphilaceae bacterium]|nr:ATP synthase subunit I [Oleiphilaceae bacterium]